MVVSEEKVVAVRLRAHRISEEGWLDIGLEETGGFGMVRGGGEMLKCGRESEYKGDVERSNGLYRGPRGDPFAWSRVFTEGGDETVEWWGVELEKWVNAKLAERTLAVRIWIASSRHWGTSDSFEWSDFLKTKYIMYIYICINICVCVCILNKG